MAISGPSLVHVDPTKSPVAAVVTAEMEGVRPQECNSEHGSWGITSGKAPLLW